MQTPFYVVKRTAVTKETARAFAVTIAGNSDSVRKKLDDLLDFCLSGPKEETVPVVLGATVRMKASEDWHYTYPGAGTVCTVCQIVLSADDDNEIQLKAVSDGDTQRVSFPNTATDLSAWLEVL